MDMLLKLKAFVVTADTGNFSAAARTLYTSPSVIMKRAKSFAVFGLFVPAAMTATRGVSWPIHGFISLQMPMP